MKKIIASISVVLIMLCFVVVPVFAATNGAVYDKPIYNACDISGNGYYVVRGTFSVNGTINNSLTSLYHMSASVDGLVYSGEGYVYIYRTSTGRTVVPYDDGYTPTTYIYYNGPCNTIKQ